MVERFDAEQVQKTIEPERPEMPAVTIAQPDLRLYDALLKRRGGVMNAAAISERTSELLVRSI